MQFHRVGIIVHVLLVKVAESILDGLPAEAARLLDVGNHQEHVQTMLEDALADIGPTLGLPLRDTVCVRNRCLEGENRRVFDVCKFSKQMFAEGWLDKGDACSPPQQFFGTLVQRHCVPASLPNGFVFVQGVLRFRQVVCLQQRSLQQHTRMCGNMVCGTHVVCSPCVVVQVRRKFVSVFVQL